MQPRTVVVSSLLLHLLPLGSGVEVNETCADPSFSTSQEGGQSEVWSTPFGALGLEARAQPLLSKLPWRTKGQFDEVVRTLAEDGAVILEDAIDTDAAALLRQHYYDDLVGHNLGGGHSSMNEVMSELASINATDMFYVAERRVEGLRVRRNGAPGRFDFKPFDKRDAGSLVKRLGLVELFEPFIAPPTLRALLGSCIQAPSGWRVKNVGTLTTLPHAHTGQWHRDIGEGLFGDESLELSLPDYYFAALAPLDETTVEQGSELLLGSHRVIARDLADAIAAGRVRHVIAAAKPGDILFFSGKLVHRGLPNPTEYDRSLVYTVYTAKWYEQGRDASREFYTGERERTPVHAS